jgi:hypothetical protein
MVAIFFLKKFMDLLCSTDLGAELSVKVLLFCGKRLSNMEKLGSIKSALTFYLLYIK